MGAIEESCWLAVRGIHPDGYAKFRVDGKLMRAHNWAWESYTGEKLRDDMELHHVCGNRNCYNPHHLWALGQAAHKFVDGRAGTHCKEGHLLEGENLYWSNNQRCCRTCHKRWSSGFRTRKQI